MATQLYRFQNPEEHRTYAKCAISFFETSCMISKEEGLRQIREETKRCLHAIALMRGIKADRFIIRHAQLKLAGMRSARALTDTL